MKKIAYNKFNYLALVIGTYYLVLPIDRSMLGCITQVIDLHYCKIVHNNSGARGTVSSAVISNDYSFYELEAYDIITI